MVSAKLYFCLLASTTSSSTTTINKNEIQPLKTDVQFHSWCESVGIVNSPSIQLATTPLSVAGRGVFAVEAICEGEPVVTIPPYCVLTSKVAAEYFPDVSKELDRKRRRSKRERGGWLSRLMRRGKTNNVGEECWQPELTAYALAAVESDHPWADWIGQWYRDDPILRLFEDGVESSDEGKVATVAEDLKGMLNDLNVLELQAAIQIRIQRFAEHMELYFRDDSDFFTKKDIARMYTILGSRALDLGDNIIGVVPMYDMVNHSLDPNLTFVINENYQLQLFASRDICAGEELFLCYNDLEEIDQNGWSETNALWTLVQWGIPIPQKVAYEQLTKYRNRKSDKKTSMEE